MSAAGPGPHLDLEELDRLAAAPAQPATGHLAACPACRDTVAGVRDVRQQLQAAGSTTPEVPQPVQRQIAAALARESAQRARTTGAAAAGEVVPPPTPAGTRGRAPVRPPRWLAAAAALVVLGGAAVTASQLLDPPSGQDASTQTAADGAETAEAAEAGSGARATGESIVPAGPVVPVATGTDYAPATLADQVTALLGAATADDGLSRNTATADAEPLRRPEALSACLRALGVPVSAPLAVDVARWQGEPATVVVVPLGSAGPDVRVLVVGAGCGAGGTELQHTARVSP